METKLEDFFEETEIKIINYLKSARRISAYINSSEGMTIEASRIAKMIQDEEHAQTIIIEKIKD